jgi:hypothetical protein
MSMADEMSQMTTESLKASPRSAADEETQREGDELSKAAELAVPKPRVKKIMKADEDVKAIKPEGAPPNATACLPAGSGSSGFAALADLPRCPLMTMLPTTPLCRPAVLRKLPRRPCAALTLVTRSSELFVGQFIEDSYHFTKVQKQTPCTPIYLCIYICVYIQLLGLPISGSKPDAPHHLGAMDRDCSACLRAESSNDAAISRRVARGSEES